MTERNEPYASRIAELEEIMSLRQQRDQNMAETRALLGMPPIEKEPLEVDSVRDEYEELIRKTVE